MSKTQYDSGHRHGVGWARDGDPDPGQLEKLASLRTGLGDGWNAYFDDPTSYEKLARQISGRPLRDAARLRAFWDDVMGELEMHFPANPDFLRGFAEGALSVYDEAHPD
jgi:hypothetical protein